MLSPAPEPLEQRIAPAVILLHAESFALFDLTGGGEAPHPARASESAAASFAVSTIAVLLHANDELRVVEPGGIAELVNVRTGDAMVFFTDLDRDGEFDPDELTGLAVSGQFAGSVHHEVNGSVATVLKKDFSVSSELQRTSIAGLSISGRITGSVLAGRDIAQLSVLSEAAAGAAYSIGGGIYTGIKAAAVPVSFNGGADEFLAVYRDAAGAAGGSIRDVTLQHGTGEISAGAGQTSKHTAGGAGGSIRGITIVSQPGPLQLSAGDGGASMFSDGGRGGMIDDVIITGYASGAASIASLEISGGTGGSGTTRTGAGGAVQKVDFRWSGEWGDITVHGGFGGLERPGASGAAGGNGGAVTEVTLHGLTVLSSARNVEILSGYGAPASGAGGRGGTLSHLTIDGEGGELLVQSLVAETGSGGGSRGQAGDGGNLLDLSLAAKRTDMTAFIAFDLGAGSGGSGQSGGRGGLVRDVQASFSSGLLEADAESAGWLFTFSGGRGGGGSNGSSGRGGSVTGVFVSATGPEGSLATLGTVYGGDGGSGTVPGAGGSIVDFTAATAGALELSLIGGAAGNGGPRSAASNLNGPGGDVRDVSLTHSAALKGALSLSIYGGGGLGYGGSNTGARGGNVSGIALEAFGPAGELRVLGGDGGTTSRRSGPPAGDGGALRDVAFALHAGASGDVKFWGGDAGTASGGAGGAMRNVSVVAEAPIAGELIIFSGNGGREAYNGVPNGKPGDVLDVSIKTPGLVDGAFISAKGLVRRMNLDTGESGRFSLTAGRLIESSIVLGDVADDFILFPGLVEDSNFVTGNVTGGYKVYAEKSIARTSFTGGEIGGALRIDAAQSLSDLRVAAGNITEGVSISSGKLERMDIRFGRANFLDLWAADSVGPEQRGGSIRDVVLRAGTIARFVAIDAGGGKIAGEIENLNADIGSALALRIKTGDGERPGGGDIRQLTLKHGGTRPTKIEIFAGGGSGGSLENLSVIAPLDTVTLAAAWASGSVAGGSIIGLSGQMAEASLFAGDGGPARNSQTRGGRGGDIQDVNLTVSRFVHKIVAGDAGGSTLPVAGGSISRVTVAGDIGDFGASFSERRMGGLWAGHGAGKTNAQLVANNGSVQDVTASRIASILAGADFPTDGAVVAINAVSRIERVAASTIGADVNGNSAVDFSNSSGLAGLVTRDGAYPIDGLVLALEQSAISFTSAQPLLLHRVSAADLAAYSQAAG